MKLDTVLLAIDATSILLYYTYTQKSIHLTDSKSALGTLLSYKLIDYYFIKNRYNNKPISNA